MIIKPYALIITAVMLLNVAAVSAADFKQQLILALHQDQQHRKEINRLKQQHNNALIQQLEQAQSQLDQGNLDTLDHIIKQLGHWPGVDDVGLNPANIALILFKRSDTDKQTKYLPLMHTAVINKQIPAVWYAEAYDHHLMMQNKPQKFGHLMIQAQAVDTQELYPIKSLTAVAAERTLLGLPDLKSSLGQRDLLLRTNFQNQTNPEILAADKIMNVAALATSCLDQIYPNSVKHVFNSAADAAPPEQLYPAFFGCFDWHSSVHGHWLLARAAKLFPNHPKSAEFIERLDAHFKPDKLMAELHYFQQPGRAGFERPYGLAWFLQLYTELHDWQHPQAQQWIKHMRPLKDHMVKQFSDWIPKLAYPIRTGEHSQTAFAFGLAYDYAVQTNDMAFKVLLTKHINRLYINDQKCPVTYEPSGQDFLSPCLAEADLMRRVMTPQQFAKWFKKFIPASKKSSNWLPVAQVTDRKDGKLAHLDGLNLARAWMLEGIASGLPEDDSRRINLAKMAMKHANSGLAAVTGEHYAGGHWLGSFAVYHLTQRGFE